MVITKFRFAFFLASILIHAALAVAIIGSRSHPASEPVEVVLFEVKGDHDNPVMTKLPSQPAARKIAKPVVVPNQESSLVPDAQKAPALAAEPSLDPRAQVRKVETPGSGDGQFGKADGAEVSAEERYTAELRAMLERRKEYPILAKRLRQQGKVIVKFTLQRDGKVMRAEVIENSEFDSLNRAAEKLITTINGLKPFPEEVRKAEWVFVLPVEYRM